MKHSDLSLRQAPMLPTFGDIPWTRLIVAVNDARGAPLEIDPSGHIGHQMAEINLNSLNRIVSGFVNEVWRELTTSAPSAVDLELVQRFELLATGADAVEIGNTRLNEARAAVLARMAATGILKWHPWGNAPKDRTPIIARLGKIDDPRWEHYSGRCFVVFHLGYAGKYDLGWSLYPGMGVGDQWFAEWAYFTDDHGAVPQGWRDIEKDPPNAGDTIIRWHKFHQCPVAVARNAGRFPGFPEWITATRDQSWPEESFTPHWMPVIAAPAHAKGA